MQRPFVVLHHALGRVEVGLQGRYVLGLVLDSLTRGWQSYEPLLANHNFVQLEPVHVYRPIRPYLHIYVIKVIKLLIEYP